MREPAPPPRSAGQDPLTEPALITSTSNRRLKFLRSLKVRKYREEAGCYLVEGIRLVEEALACGAPVDTLIYAPELLVSGRAQGLVAQVEPARRLALSAEAFHTLSEREDPQGIAALVRVVERSLDQIPASRDMLAIVAHQIRDPGNLGTIIRTADAVGASGVVLVEPCADPYDPQAVRATMGSLFAVPVVRLQHESDLIGWYRDIRATGLPLLVVASSAHGHVVHFDVDYRRPVVLLVGSERDGLPPSMREAADLVVRLPMSRRATSLNVAAAMAALVYEIVRQRRLPGGPHP